MRKVEILRLIELETLGVIRIIDADQAFAMLKSGNKRQNKRAGDVRAAMRKNFEVLIEGAIPSADLTFVS